jgi:hypothetical protein
MFGNLFGVLSTVYNLGTFSAFKYNFMIFQIRFILFGPFGFCTILFQVLKTFECFE